jgi:hypothetical protein
MLLVPSTAIVRDGTSASIYVQHTPERFDTRQVAIGQTFGNLVQVTNGLRDGDRVVVRGTDKMPDNEASMNESDWCASGSLDRIVCDNQRSSAKDDRDRDNNE